MASQAITPGSLMHCIYKDDMYSYTSLSDPVEKCRIIESAYNMSQALRLLPTITRVDRNNKTCYSLKEIDQILISRNLAKNLQKTLPKSRSRNNISRQLAQHLKEGTSYRVYRLDIKNFFESLDVSTIQDALEKSAVSSQTRLLMINIINECNKISQCGLPRGLEFSPAIAELILQDFDRGIKKNKDVFFYCRYVDDILIITSGLEASKRFLRYIKNSLPGGLSLNYNKQKIICVDKRSKLDKVVAQFDYLGYSYIVRDTATKAFTSVFRELDVCLSKSRIKKIKTKISRSLYLYSKDGDFDILKKRIIFLTSNRLMKNKKTNHVIATGLYYNNINLTNGCGLDELDSYLKKRVLGCSAKRGANSLHSLSLDQKREILKFSFVNGYRNDNYKRFSPNKLGEIKDAWRY